MRRRKLLLAAALGALAAATAASAATQSPRRPAQQPSGASLLLTGVTYSRQVEFTSRGPIVFDVVTAPRPDGTVYTLAPALSNDALRGTEKLSALGQRLAAEATTVAVDADAFDRRSGVPRGIVLQGGVLENQPSPGRSSLGIGADGQLSVARVSYAGTWQGSGQRRPLLLNAAKGRFTLYTPAYGPKTPREAGVVEDVIPVFPPARLDQPLAGTVAQVASAGPTPIPRGGAVLVARGPQATAQLRAEAPAGQTVDVWLSLSPDWSSLAAAIGGGPLLVRNGRPVFQPGEAFAPRWLASRQPRCAVGQRLDGRILLVCAEGTSPAYSIGVSSYELAVELARLGATTAYGLGAGPAAGMAFDGTLLTRPPSGREVRVSDALVLSYSGVYAAPPSTPVLSPNGDGVGDSETLTYKLVRPSTVSAVLSGPGGRTISLASGAQPPGLYQLSWDGSDGGALAPEGAWTFTVTARDDRGVTTSAERTFSLDDTLSALAVASGARGQVVATFRLARAADVIVRVERPDGVPVATVLSAPLPAGQQRAVWRGRIDGRAAPAGRYQVDVQATSSVGTSSLVAPFSLLPHAPRR